MKILLNMMLLCAWVAMAIAGGTNMPGAVPTPEKMAENGLQRAIRAVCSVTAYDADGRAFSTGSAVIFATNMAVTCHHVVSGAATITLEAYDGTKLQVIAYTPRNSDTEYKILKIAGNHIPDQISWNKGSWPFYDSPNTPYKVGDRVYAIGNPQGLSGTVSDGIISAFRTYEGYGEIIQTSAPISQGSSGGALVNPEGQLIGIIVMQMKDGQNLNFALAGRIVRCYFTYVLDGYADRDQEWGILPIPKR